MIRKTLYLCFGIVVAAFISLNACSSNMNANAQENKDEQSELELKKLQEQKSVWESDLADKSRFTLNLKLNAQERSLARSHAKSVTTNLQKNNFYVHYLLTKLKEANIPLEMAAIPLVESGLNPHVHNKGAHGAWQYVRSTGYSLGLKRSRGYDGIYDFFASTDAGVKYLNRLYQDLGDWQLVVVAYNQGEYGVKRAIGNAQKKGIKHPTANDIVISRTARTYLTRFKAYSDILKNPQAYGVTLPNIKNRTAFRKVEVAGKVSSLHEAARLSGASLDVLKKLNSGYTSDKIDPTRGLLVPIEHADTFEKAIYGKSAEKYPEDIPLKIKN